MIWVLQHWQEAGRVLGFPYPVALLTIVPQRLGVSGFSRLLCLSKL